MGGVGRGWGGVGGGQDGPGGREGQVGWFGLAGRNLRNVSSPKGRTCVE